MKERTEWLDKETPRRIAWFNSLPVPDKPFKFGPFTVSEPPKFFASMRRDLAQGPGATRNYLGCVESELAMLEETLKNHPAR